MSDIIDEIDALVDWQLEQESSGYDHNINQAACRICRGPWHGLAITATLHKMRKQYASAQITADVIGASWPVDREERRLAEYRHADDDSEILCPGSKFIGPWATREQRRRMRTVRTAAMGAMEWNHDPRSLDLELSRMPVTGGSLPVLTSDAIQPGQIFVVGPHGRRTLMGHSASIETTDETREREGLNVEGRYDPVRTMTEGHFSVPADSQMARWLLGEHNSLSDDDLRALRNRPWAELVDGIGIVSSEVQTGHARGAVWQGGRHSPNFDPARIDSVQLAAASFREATRPMFERIAELFQNISTSMQSMSAAVNDAPPEPQTPQQRALPRPSTTPPMWAVDPSRSRRPRRNRNQPTRQGIA